MTKRHRGRTVYANLRTLRAWHHYIAIERDAAVARPRARGHFDHLEDIIPVSRAGRHALSVRGTARSWAYSKIDVAARQQLYRVDTEVRTGSTAHHLVAVDARRL